MTRWRDSTEEDYQENRSERSKSSHGRTTKLLLSPCLWLLIVAVLLSTTSVFWIFDLEQRTLSSIHELNHQYLEGTRENLGYTKQESNKIGDLGRHVPLKLPVKEGDMIHASFVATARRSIFYYQIVAAKGNATELLGSKQLIDNRDQSWRSIATQAIFRSKIDGELELSVEFLEQELSGKIEVFGSSLIAINRGASGVKLK